MSSRRIRHQFTPNWTINRLGTKDNPNVLRMNKCQRKPKGQSIIDNPETRSNFEHNKKNEDTQQKT